MEEQPHQNEPLADSASTGSPVPPPVPPVQPGQSNPPAVETQQMPYPQQPGTPQQPPASGQFSTPQQPPAPGQPSMPYGQQPSYYQPMQSAPSGKATGALVCGILAILLAWAPLFGVVLGIVAIVLAGKAIKEAGKNGKTTGGKACGIIGIVLSVLAFIFYLVVGFGALLYVATNSDDLSYSSSSSAVDALSDSSSATTGEEQQIETVATAELDKLKNKDEAVVAKIAGDLDQGLAESTGYGLTDLGVDPASFAQWMLADFDYQVDNVFDYGDGTGVLYADVTMRDANAFASTFMEDAQAAIDAGEFDVADEAAAKAKLGELYQAAMDKSTDMTDYYAGVEVLKDGDTWKVDEDAWNNMELETMFGIY